MLHTIHARDIAAAKATLGVKTNRFRRRKDRAELVRVMEDAAEAFNLRRLARVASKIGGAR